VPTYAYACTECGHRFDAVQKFSDAALTTCPQCEGRLRKVYTSIGVTFKGSGFYRTDSRAGSNGSGKSSETESAGSSDSSSSKKESAEGGSSSDSSGGGDKKSPASSGSSSKPAAAAKAATS
jgi:putative FmdB family regulatory protein